jgi:hypothetical protein
VATALPGPAATNEGIVPPTIPYDPEPERERLRGVLALVIVGLFVFVILLGFLLFTFTTRPADELKDFLVLVITPVTSLVSAVVGFYYGSTTARQP